MAVKCPKCDLENTSDSKFCKECGTQLISAEALAASKTLTIDTDAEGLTRGTVFAERYEVLERIGAGGMGTVYRVYDRKLEEEVALKLIRPEITARGKSLERFKNELKIARKIAHKNICKMYDLGETGETSYITMEYVPGEDLKSFIRRIGQLPAAKAVILAREIAEGLAEAHKLGIVHRDLKPGNIMIDRDGNAKIMDFGIARSLLSKRLTGEMAIIGTPEYMSPEQVDGKEADQRADLYALSIILYEMVTGRVPFEGDTAFAVGLKQKSEPPENPKKLNPQIPDDLSRLILKGLEKNREKRYQTAAEVLSELTKIEQELPTTEKVAAKRKPLTSKEITVHFSLRKLLIPGLALAATATIIVFLILFTNKPSSKPPLVLFPKQVTFTGNASCPAIAPDGKFLAYATSEDGEQAVYVHDMVSGQSLKLFRAHTCQNLRWTPDGSEISFWAKLKDSSTGIFVVPRLGGSQRRLVAAEFFAWSPDGSRFASCNADSKEIRITNKTTGESTTIPFQGSLGSPEGVDWSPKASFLLLHSNYESHKFAIWTISIDGKLQNEVFEGDVFSPRWSSRECAIYFERYRPSSTFEILKIPISPNSGKPTKPAAVIWSQTGKIGDFTITSDGKMLLYAQELTSMNLWQVTVAGSGKSQTVDAQQLTKGTFHNSCPDISPDGKNVAFSRGSGTMNIYVMPVGGASPQQITYMNSLNLYPVWSPDGNEIAFNSNQQGVAKVWKVSSQGGNPSQLTVSKLADVSGNIAWAPVKTILYPGHEGYIILDPDTGKETLLRENSDLKIYFARYSPDGKKVAVYGSRPPNSDGLWVISREDSSPVFLQKGDIFPIRWSSDGKLVYASESVPGAIKIIAAASENKVVETVFTLPFTPEKGLPLPYQVTMTPDAKKFIFPVQRMQSDVWAVENFDPLTKDPNGN